MSGRKALRTDQARRSERAQSKRGKRARLPAGVPSLVTSPREAPHWRPDMEDFVRFAETAKELKAAIVSRDESLKIQDEAVAKLTAASNATREELTLKRREVAALAKANGALMWALESVHVAATKED